MASAIGSGVQVEDESRTHAGPQRDVGDVGDFADGGVGQSHDREAGGARLSERVQRFLGITR